MPPPFVKNFVLSLHNRVAPLADGTDERFAAYAIGILAGAAMHDWVTFSPELVDAASACRSMEAALEVERRSYSERITGL